LDSRATSISRLRNASFLEMQMLVNNKNFLENQLAVMDLRKKQIGKKLEDLLKEMKRVEETVNRQSHMIRNSGDKNKRFGVEMKTVEYC